MGILEIDFERMVRASFLIALTPSGSSLMGKNSIPSSYLSFNRSLQLVVLGVLT